MLHIDLNSDLGESYGAWKMGDDQAMLNIVSSANIACGYHAGDPKGILATVKAAAKKGVRIGAHVSYPDRVGFGRRQLAISADELFADVLYQIGALHGLAQAAGTQLDYIKPHGALYNTIAHDQVQAQAVIDAIIAYDASLPLVALAGSPLILLAHQRNVITIAEAFADRAYHSDGTLVSRRDPGAVLHDPHQVAQRMIELVMNQSLTSIEGVLTPLQADSICIHGDTPDAVTMALTIRDALESVGVSIRSFCS
ncbi:MAG: 5-oxoprolinase subunit A [Candidatus Celerinatantimonas neptuna]|nr:MAG: 5-oxoprolinase subunit A [Candidatus Celerinatantimonas neptuna]